MGCRNCHRGVQQSGGTCLDFTLFLADSCSYTGCAWSSFFCIFLSSWDENVHLICVGGGTILHKSTDLVDLRHPKIYLHAVIRTAPIFEACDGLPKTERILGSGEKQSNARGVDSSGVCSPVGIRQLLHDAVPGFSVCLAMWSLYVSERSWVTHM